MTCQGCSAELQQPRSGRRRKWCSDKCRKRTLYSLPCADCGQPCNTDGRVTGASERCLACYTKHRRQIARAYVIDSIREWAERFGYPPTSVDWNQAMCRAKGWAAKIERYEATGRPWPSQGEVQLRYGTWNAALEAAGFRPLARSEHWIGRAGVTLREQDQAAA
jgi:hypothetical protein